MISKTIFGTVALALGVLSLCPVTALAEAWPSKTIRMIVPFPPGGGMDYIGRIVGQKLSERLGQQVAIDNRAGATRLESYCASSANGCAVRWRICRGGVFPTVRDVA